MRLVLARAIVGNPRLLLLDESLEGLDIATFKEIEKYLFDQSHPWTLLLVTRDPELVKRCDQVIQLGECHLGHARSTSAA
jgi:predicted ABC-type transport system involved in lysophospholipase L1 biosynthesis ATPase subunit